MKIDISIIIVTWNCKQYVLQCLESIYSNDQEISFEVIVIDNNSADATVDEIQKRFPSVKVIANFRNIGFAGANNQGIAASSAGFTLLLNPDTIVHKHALKNMLVFIKSNETIGAIGPKILNNNGTVQYAGIQFPDNWNIFCEALFLDRIFPHSRIFGKHKSLYEDFSKPFPVNYAQGSALLLRRSALDAAGFLDERFFMYFEETDLCLRIKKKGYTIYFYPGATITHFGGGETGHYTERRLLHYHESLIKFYKKHFLPGSLVLLRFIITIRSAIRIIVWSCMLIPKFAQRKKIYSILTGYFKSFKIVLHE
ncbi:MAG: glycosyltransferase family 2 protein [bacterium]|nr:glycosyltransferase family 2 protein [bacterium]